LILTDHSIITINQPINQFRLLKARQKLRSQLTQPQLGTVTENPVL